MAKRAMKKEEQTGVEKHDSAFLSPLMLFKGSPHNDTFVGTRYALIDATPDNHLADTYTFTHRGHDFGLLKTSEATLSADLKLVVAATNANVANNAAITPNALFLRGAAWSSIQVYLNNVLVSNMSNYEDQLSWIRHLVTETPENYYPSRNITLAIHDTAGHFDSIVNMGDGGDRLVNRGAHARQRLFNNGAVVHAIDTLDTVCFNENDPDRYMPSDFDFKIVFRRAAKTKYLFGTDALGQATDVLIRNFR